MVFQMGPSRHNVWGMSSTNDCPVLVLEVCDEGQRGRLIVLLQGTETFLNKFYFYFSSIWFGHFIQVLKDRQDVCVGSAVATGVCQWSHVQDHISAG